MNSLMSYNPLAPTNTQPPQQGGINQFMMSPWTSIGMNLLAANDGRPGSMGRGLSQGMNQYSVLQNQALRNQMYGAQLKQYEMLNEIRAKEQEREDARREAINKSYQTLQGSGSPYAALPPEMAVESYAQSLVDQQQTTANMRDFGLVQRDPKYKEFLRLTGSNNVPANIQEWRLYESLSPDKKEEYLTLRRANRLYNTGDQFVRVPQTGGAPQPVMPVNVPPEQTPEHKANVVTAQEEAKREAGKIAEQPARQQSLAGKEAKTEMLSSMIDSAKDKAGYWTTGLIGSALSKVPGTPAYDLAANLDTIKANIGFDRLQEMRDSSKTGGALGQVSEMENKLLQAVWGNLINSQSKEQFKANLDLVQKQINESWARVYKAYERDYGIPYNAAGAQQQASQPTREAIEAEMKRRGLMQ